MATFKKCSLFYSDHFYAQLHSSQKEYSHECSYYRFISTTWLITLVWVICSPCLIKVRANENCLALLLKLENRVFTYLWPDLKRKPIHKVCFHNLIKGKATVNLILNFKATPMWTERIVECHGASLLELPRLSGFLEGSNLCEGKCCRTAISLEQGQSAVEPI